MDVLAILSGFGVDAIVGLTGVGGGSLMTPLLMGAFGLPAAAATIAWLNFSGVGKDRGVLTTVLGVAGLLTALSLVYRRAWAWLALSLQRHIPAARKPALTVLADALGVTMLTVDLKVIH